MKTCIVIPTYNERENIGRIIEQILALHIPEVSVVVVDDNSPDGTGELVASIEKKNPAIKLLRRSGKQGLGKAYIAGFTAALENGAEAIVQMDADFSHDPRYIPQLLVGLATADVVIGSRYSGNGGARDWNFFRSSISRLGNWYARHVLRVSMHDVTGGFKCFSRRALEIIDYKNCDSVGFNFQVEMNYRATKNKLVTLEVPYVFQPRAAGKSKFSLAIMIESFWKILQLRYRHDIQKNF